MLNVLKAIRYSVLVTFIILNAVILSIAVWNLSIVHYIGLVSAATQIDAYLIFLGAFGLLLAFPIIFLDVCGSELFLGRVWFELLWVGLFAIMNLVAAGLITTQSGSQLCDPKLDSTLRKLHGQSPCASAQALQAFTWISACLLLGYWLVLFAFSWVRSSKDPAIWFCVARHFPWYGGRNPLESQPESPVDELKPVKQRRSLFAPRPQRVVPFKEAFVSRPQWDVEHNPSSIAVVSRPVPPVPAARGPSRPMEQISSSQAIRSTPLYPSHVQTTIERNAAAGGRSLSDPTAFQFPKPSSSDPPPLGDWPRLDALSRPSRVKPKPLPVPVPAVVAPAPVAAPSSYNLNVSALTAALQSLNTHKEVEPLPSIPMQPAQHSQQSSLDRTRPIGPRRKQGSGDYRRNRPPQLDLSSISSHRVRGS